MTEHQTAYWRTRKDEVTASPLAFTLQVAVPLRIYELESRGGPDDQDLAWATAFGQELGEKGDRLLFRGQKEGESADLFNKLARAVAILSFCPGGITIFGAYFEAHIP